MLFALSTGHKIGLAGTGAAFILFSLVSAMVIPRMNANFPGRHLRLYLVICVAFFVAMISAVLVFGKEKKAAAASTTPAVTTTTAAASTGDPVAGKAVFASSGCAACHTFVPAAATGKVGPDLDNLAAYAAKASQPVTTFAKSAIEKPPAAYVPPGFPTNVMPPDGGATLTATQLDNLVAFLTQSK